MRQFCRHPGKLMASGAHTAPPLTWAVQIGSAQQGQPLCCLCLSPNVVVWRRHQLHLQVAVSNVRSIRTCVPHTQQQAETDSGL